MTGITADGIEIDRDFAAAPDAVFDAWTTASSFAQWFGGRAVEVPMDSLDYAAEAGRSWSATMVLPQGATMSWGGEFLEVDRARRVAMTITDRPADEARAALTIDLTPTETGTRLIMTQQTPGFAPEQQQATIDGWQGFLDVLGEIAAGA